MEHRVQWQRDNSSSLCSASLLLGDPKQGSEVTYLFPKLENVMGAAKWYVERNDSYGSCLVPGSTCGAQREGILVSDQFTHAPVLPLVDSGVVLKKQMPKLRSGIFLLRHSSLRFIALALKLKL